ncbi:MAG: hypothetical protein WCH99_01800 [Verrucomicrobiota bacterium]
MNQVAFINQLRLTAKTLTPLTQSADAGASTWNGVEYVKSDKPIFPDPYALSWQATLVAIAELLEFQESSATEKQIKYLERLLFGGMGSLNDLFFDPRSGGDIARVVNENLNKQRQALFFIFKNN